MDADAYRPVTVIIGRVRRTRSSGWENVHVMLVAPDDDSAVRMTLTALKREGYVEVELDRIGDLDEAPDEEPHMSAYQGAVEGEVAIVVMKTL